MPCFASELLFAKNQQFGGSRAPFAAPEGFQFTIQFPSTSSANGLSQFGSGVFWQNAESGTHEFYLTQDPPEFQELSSVLTNGFDDNLTFYLANAIGDSSGYGPWEESNWGFGYPDLSGNQITSIRLVVQNLSIQPYFDPPFGNGLQWDAQITWEFWGNPVPEPSTALLTLAALIVFSIRRRR